jgi:hypothetical protein
LRVAAAIVVDAAAFSLWNLATRSPFRLVRDVVAGTTQPLTALRSVARFIAGLILLIAGAVLLLPLAIQTRTFTILETWTAVTGLLVEQLIGYSNKPSQ